MKQQNKQILSYLIEHGELADMSRAAQIKLFANACDGPDDMFRLANSLAKSKAKDNGVIKFHPNELKQIAAKIKEGKCQEIKDAESEATGDVVPVPMKAQTSSKPIVQIPAGKAASTTTNGLGFNAKSFVASSAQKSNLVPIGTSNPVNRNNTPSGVNLNTAPGNLPVVGETVAANQQNRHPVQREIPQFVAEGYSNMPVDAKVDVIEKFLADNPQVNRVPDAWPEMSNDQKVAELRNICKFIPNKHSMKPLQILCLHSMVKDPTFIAELSKYGAKINPLYMREVDGAPYPADTRYDFKFVVETNKDDEDVLIKALSVPEYDNRDGSWKTHYAVSRFKYKKGKKLYKKDVNPASETMGTLGDVVVQDNAGEANMTLKQFTDAMFDSQRQHFDQYGNGYVVGCVTPGINGIPYSDMPTMF